MKNLLLLSFIMFAFTGMGYAESTTTQPDSLGLPGDNLNLYAVMDLFTQSKTLEEFEKSLNDEKNKVNNLDLNGDNQIDYLKVIDNVDGSTHIITIQDPVNEKENQDVAVFTVDKSDKDGAQIQLIGDEELYGKNYIIEPSSSSAKSSKQATANPGYSGNNNSTVERTKTTTYVVVDYPVVSYIYAPVYHPWVSPWYWAYYPSYWHPWTPFYWHYYYGFHYPRYQYYYAHYRRWDSYRSPYYQSYYGSRRSVSVYVDNRRQTNQYITTYSHPEMRSRGTQEYVKGNPSRGTGRPVTTRPGSRNKVVSTPRNRAAVAGNKAVQPVKPAAGLQQHNSTPVGREASPAKRSPDKALPQPSGNHNNQIRENNSRQNAAPTHSLQNTNASRPQHLNTPGRQMQHPQTPRQQGGRQEHKNR